MDSSDPLTRVFLGLGSNRGDGRAILAGAAEALSARLTDCRVSSFYSSAPMYVVDQPEFLNAAVSGEFAGSPYELLSLVNGIERDFGRNRAKERRMGERTLDIDILLFGSLVVADPPALVIPHAGLLERKFALLPLLELDPEAVDPRTGRALARSFAELETQGIYYADLSPL